MEPSTETVPQTKTSWIENAYEGAREESAEPTPAQQYRMEHCGWRLGRRFKHHTDEYDSFNWSCGQWRCGCIYCLSERIEYLRNQMLKAVVEARTDEQEIYFIFADDEQAKSICRQLDREEYKRHPMTFGNAIFTTEKVEGSKLVTYDEIEAMNWEEIVMTPVKRRTSGSLGQSPKVENPNVEMIQVPEFALDPETTEEQEFAALKAAYNSTKDEELPKTPSEVERLLKIQAEAYAKALLESGGKLLREVKYKAKECDITRISWKKVYELSDNEIKAMLPGSMDEIPF